MANRRSVIACGRYEELDGRTIRARPARRQARVLSHPSARAHRAIRAHRGTDPGGSTRARALTEPAI